MSSLQTHTERDQRQQETEREQAEKTRGEK